MAGADQRFTSDVAAMSVSKTNCRHRGNNVFVMLHQVIIQMPFLSFNNINWFMMIQSD